MRVKNKTIPAQALGYQEVEAHESGKVVSPTHLPPLPPQEIFLVLIFATG